MNTKKIALLTLAQTFADLNLFQQEAVENACLESECPEDNLLLVLGDELQQIIDGLIKKAEELES